jgi:hypothetical protein
MKNYEHNIIMQNALNSPKLEHPKYPLLLNGAKVMYQEWGTCLQSQH